MTVDLSGTNRQRESLGLGEFVNAIRKCRDSLTVSRHAGKLVVTGPDTFLVVLAKQLGMPMCARW